MKRAQTSPIRICIALLAVFFGVNADALQRDDYTWIQLPKKHIVSGTSTVLYLSDIADTIKSPDAEFIKEIITVPLMEVPEPGTHRRLAHHQIILALRKAHIDTLTIQFLGNKLVDVYGPGQKITREDMVEAVEQHIRKETGASPERMRLQVISSPANDAWLPPGEYEIHVERVNPNLLGTSRYNIRFLQDRIVIDEMAILANVAKKRNVYMPVTNLSRGTVIQPDHLRKEVRFIDQETKDKLYISSPGEIIGKKCRNHIRNTEILTRNMLETNYVVNRGEVVRAMLNNDKFTLQTTAKAESRGAPGDIIPIKMEVTGKVMNARVLNSQVVEIVTNS